MARLGIRPNKGLGQNFLYERGIVQRMVRSARIGSTDTVVEVGPGLGILTDELLLRAGRVIAIELDRTLAAHLTDHFGDNPNFSLHSGDALRVDLNHVLEGVDRLQAHGEPPYGVAAAVDETVPGSGQRADATDRDAATRGRATIGGRATEHDDSLGRDAVLF